MKGRGLPFACPDGALANLPLPCVCVCLFVYLCRLLCKSFRNTNKVEYLGYAVLMRAWGQ